jgi:hypothetical protein
MRSVRGAASAMRSLGSGHPPVRRFRLGIEFAMSGHRELDGMIDHHAKMTRQHPAHHPGNGGPDPRAAARTPDARTGKHQHEH